MNVCSRFKRKAGRKYTGLLSRLLVLIFILCVLVLTITTISGNVFFRRMLISSVQSLEEEYISVQRDHINALLGRYCYSVYELAIDPELLRLAKDIQSGDREFEARQAIYDKLLTLAGSSEIQSITFSPLDNNFVYYSHIFTPHFTYYWHSHLKEDGTNQALADLCAQAQKKGNIVFGATPNSISRVNYHFFHIACPVYDLMNKHSYGTVVLTFSLEPLQEIVNPSARHQDISSGILVGPNGVIYDHTDPRWIGEPFISTESAVERGILPKDSLILCSHSDRYNFTLYGIINSGLLNRHAARLILLQTLAVCLVIAVIFSVIAVILSRMTRSTRSLLAGLEQLSTGNLRTIIPVTDSHEIGRITRAVNNLSRQLLIMKNRETQQAKQTLDALNQKHLAEMRVLEQQINAHFLYNTLNSINYTAIENDDLPVSQQIQHLSVILRYALERREESVCAWQVVDWLNAYLFLQKLRYGSSFDYRCTIDDDLRDWPMRKLLVQPFVENAVLHGFSGRSFGGFMTITFRRFREDCMRITITDNGHGIPADRCREINDYFSGKKEDLSASRGVGLTNACQRLRVYYHNKAKVFFRSEPECQTVVTILLPRYQESSFMDNSLR